MGKRVQKEKETRDNEQLDKMEGDKGISGETQGKKGGLKEGDEKEISGDRERRRKVDKGRRDGIYVLRE